MIVYSGKNKVETVREQDFEQGYAVCAEELLKWVNGQIPSREVIGVAGRDDVRMYSKRTMRELVMNSLIHQRKVENPDVQKRADICYVPFWA